MTGEKNRYTTFEKMQRFEDKDLSTPEHDAMVLSLLKPENVKALMSCIGCKEEWKHRLSMNFNLPGCFPHERKPSDMKEEDYKAMYNEAAASFKIKAKAEYDKFMAVKDKLPKEIKTEVPIVTGNNRFIIGYIDVQYRMCFGDCIHISSDTVKCEYTGTEYSKGSYVPVSKKVCACYDGALWITDTSAEAVFPNSRSWSYDETFSGVVNIEVKPHIQSFGETMRQLNTYREHFNTHDGLTGLSVPSAVFVIYSPDDRFRDAFEAQGIKFITPNDIAAKQIAEW